MSEHMNFQLLELLIAEHITEKVIKRLRERGLLRRVMGIGSHDGIKIEGMKGWTIAISPSTTLIRFDETDYQFHSGDGSISSNFEPSYEWRTKHCWNVPKSKFVFLEEEGES